MKDEGEEVYVSHFQGLGYSEEALRASWKRVSEEVHVYWRLRARGAG